MLDKEKESFSTNPLLEMHKELSLFEQTNYCVRYIKNTISNISDSKAIEQGEIAGACFRQASEYYEAGKKVSLSTRPLLLSYSMNNYVKGMAYLTTTNDDILKGFNSHGFAYEYKTSFLESSITKREKGVVSSLEKMVQDTEIKKESIVPLYSLLSLIPGLRKIFNETTEYISHISLPLNKNNTFKLTTNEKPHLIEEFGFGLMGFVSTKVRKHPYWGDEGYTGFFNITGSEYIRNLKGLNIFSNKKIFFPILIDGTSIFVQPMVASYLIIMFYGMLVRYNPEKWDKVIDAKISNNYSLIKASMEECYNEFIVSLYRYIFNQRIVKKEYNNNDFRKYINENKSEIFDIIEKEKKDRKRYRGF